MSNDIARPQADEPLSPCVRACLLLIVLGGLCLRLAFPEVTVFWLDQAEACALAEDITNRDWQTAGLFNSSGFRNLPGFVYVMAAVWAVWPDPLALVSFTAVVNALAVIAAAYLLLRWVGPSAAWWATAFLAAGPWPIQHSRWIWGQDLLFPAALLVYLFLYLWVSRGRKWAALGVVLSLTLVVQIHLAGIVLWLAVGFFLLWSRPKMPVCPLVIGTLVAAASVVPYVCGGHLATPPAHRFGYEHAWRVVAGAAMSVTGLGWQWTFLEASPSFAQSMHWRRWPYEALMVLPVALFAWGAFMGLRRLWQQRHAELSQRRSPLGMVSALTLLIPLSFAVSGIRTSPTHLPLWYPLPFALMGWAAVRLGRPRPGRHRRTWSNWVLLAVLTTQLCFFSEQLLYVRSHGGVPHSRVGRSYAGAQADFAKLVPLVRAREIWMAYESSPSPCSSVWLVSAC